MGRGAGSGNVEEKSVSIYGSSFNSYGKIKSSGYGSEIEEVAEVITLRNAIHLKLVEDETYRLLLGEPIAEPYQTYYINPPERPTFPEVVWGPITGNYNTDVADFLSQWLVVPFNVWAKSNVYDTIADRIIWLLHHKSNTAGFSAMVQDVPQEIYDEDMDAFGVRFTFQVHYGRPVI